MINKQAFKLSGVTEEEYLQWCKDNGKCFSKVETRREFFQRIQANKLIKNEDNKVVGRRK